MLTETITQGKIVQGQRELPDTYALAVANAAAYLLNKEYKRTAKAGNRLIWICLMWAVFSVLAWAGR